MGLDTGSGDNVKVEMISRLRLEMTGRGFELSGKVIGMTRWEPGFASSLFFVSEENSF